MNNEPNYIETRLEQAKRMRDKSIRGTPSFKLWDERVKQISKKLDRPVWGLGFLVMIILGVAFWAFVAWTLL